VFGLDARSSHDELMDTVSLPAPVADRTLRFLEWTNRSFGGTGIVLRHLERWRRAWPGGRTITLLDVGTGAADIPRAIVAWAAASGVRVHVTAIEPAADIARIAQARVNGMPGISVEPVGLDDVATTSRRFDYVIGSLFLHHVPQARIRETLLAMDRLAVRGVIVGDLVRSPVAWLGVGFLALVAGNAVVRHDGPLSVRRAFTVAELRDLAAAAGLRYLRARGEGPFRLSLAGEKEPHE
jgi:2-polyprenyl-3-methyl-5-hydroxy-6-metoxy-1,4-benzoquinol methylase